MLSRFQFTADEYANSHSGNDSGNVLVMKELPHIPPSSKIIVLVKQDQKSKDKDHRG